jgi:hypothetical protein
MRWPAHQRGQFAAAEGKGGDYRAVEGMKVNIVEAR